MNVILIVETFVTFVLAVTIHESAHAFAAALLGDATPVSEGRLSLAPRRQMAAIGTIVAIVYAVGSAFVPAGLGWGRPVNVDARRMRVGPNAGTILVALAGPVANLVIGLLVAAGLHAVPSYIALDARSGNCLANGTSGQFLQMCLSGAQQGYVLRIEQFAFAFAVTNVLLAIVNIIPLHPLDGYKVLFALLPNDQAIKYRSYEGYMEFALLVLFFVVPYLFALFRIGINPADYLISAANHVVAQIAGNAYAFYQYL